jgi:hypothetical protein
LKVLATDNRAVFTAAAHAQRAAEFINTRALTGRVERAKESGLDVAEMQKQIRADSLKSLASNGYGASLTSAMTAGIAHFGAPVPLQVWVNWNIADIDKNLGRA